MDVEVSEGIHAEEAVDASFLRQVMADYLQVVYRLADRRERGHGGDRGISDR